MEPTHPDSVPSLVGEDHVCDACGTDYRATTVDDVRATVVAVPGRARELVTGSPDESWRRADDGWCAAEYLCHVRDVFATSTIRLFRTRTEDDPPLEPVFNDLRARRFGYRDAAHEGRRHLQDMALRARA